jgi:hypothetical protein
MKTVALLLLVAASTPGYAAAPELDAEGLGQAMAHAATILAGRADADSLAAAAVLTHLTDVPRAEQLAARASAAAPKRTDLLWLHGQLCQEVPDCNRKPIDTKLQALDPANGAVYLPQLQNLSGGSPADTERLLARIAATQKVDFYWNPLVAHLGQAMVATKTLPAGQAVMAIIGAASAAVIPPVSGAAVPCRDWIPRDERRNQCKAIARAFLRGDTAIAEAAGYSMTLALWPDESPEAHAASEGRRTLAYQAITNGTESARRFGNEAGVQGYLEKLGRYRREQEVIAAELLEAGLSATPPADWRPTPPASGAFAPAAPPATR